MNEQPTLTASPLDFTEAIECRFGQLQAVLAKANAAGFDAVRMSCIVGGYRLTFQRRPASMATSKAPAMRTCAGCQHWQFVADDFGQCDRQRDAMTAANQTCGQWHPAPIRENNQ